jgi:cytochrome o ubiquinol oxidase subunit IV
MMTTTPITVQQKRNIIRYVIGFAASIVLTVLAYVIVVNHVLSGWSLGYAILGLALVQATVQLVCFMHIGNEREPRWELLVLDMTLLIMAILVFGSLWIMNNLNYNMMTPSQTNTYMHENEGL